MELLTIGAFAQAARLTPKALRLYDDLGLLPPAAVDPDSAYRLYDPRQLGRARLIARLRGLGMPLAEIRTVCDLEPAAAAEAVAAYGRRTAADAADRAHRVALLVDELTRKDTTMTLHFTWAARTDIGASRELHEDAAYAGERLLAVADGLGGHGGGADASAAAIDALKAVEMADVPAAEMLTVLAAVVGDVNRSVRDSATGDRRPGTTLTALLRNGSRLALVHIGDTRAYLLRGGELSLLTQDHTWVRDEIDQGRMTSDEAAEHPRRSVLTRALGAVGPDVEADLALRTALPGDRYLLCSDGLSGVVSRPAIQEALTAGDDPDTTAGRLVALAFEAGAPDNIAVVVADVVEG